MRYRAPITLPGHTGVGKGQIPNTKHMKSNSRTQTPP